MVRVEQYHLQPTELLPNSPHPLLYYPRYLAREVESHPDVARRVFDMYASNGWQPQWIFRYGATQASHYHSEAHECMVILHGSATIRFGAADTDPDLDRNTHGGAFEAGGVEIAATAGDVFIIPAGVAHKTFDTTPAEFALLSPGNGHGIAPAHRDTLARMTLDGFVMMGAYGEGDHWDFATGGEHAGQYHKVWSVPKPQLDPMLGNSGHGLCGLWKERELPSGGNHDVRSGH